MRGPIAIFRSFPITVRAPLVVATLMFIVAAIASQQVLSRLSKTQTQHLSGLADAYLDGLSAAIIPHVLRKDVWEVFDVLDRSRDKYLALRPVETVVTDDVERIIASSNPRSLLSQSPIPEIYSQRFAEHNNLFIEPLRQRAYARRDLRYLGRKIGTIYATMDVTHLMAERRTVFLELIFTNIIMTILLAGIGYLLVRQMLKPVRVLADHLEEGARGNVEIIPSTLIQQKRSEFGRLFRNYNALANAVNERSALAERLAAEERLASLGRLASGMAHEINNPLGGLFNAVDTLKIHGKNAEVRKSSLNLLERGLSGIRDVVSAALTTYRPERRTRNLNSNDIDDLALLLQPELRRRKLSLHWKNRIENEISINATPVRQAALNLLLNATNASPKGSAISLSANSTEDKFTISVGDSGKGLPEKAKSFLISDSDDAIPVVEGSGIGLWMVHRLVQQIGGTIEVGKSEFGGTLITCNIIFEAKTKVLENAA